MVVGEALTRRLFPCSPQQWLTFDIRAPEADWWRSIALSTPAEAPQPPDASACPQPASTSVSTDSESADSDDDPALVSEKVAAPVYVPPRAGRCSLPRYVRDLVAMLRDASYPRLRAALHAAPALIRRKAAFGTELTHHALALARLLAALNDEFGLRGFVEHKLAALAALVAACPDPVAPYLVDEYFTGDISVQQRSMILSALAMGAHEIAAGDAQAPFPSRSLPPTLHAHYLALDAPRTPRDRKSVV